MRRLRRGHCYGTTLIELLIYGVLLLLLLSGVYGAFYISQLYYDSARGSTEAQQEAIKGMAAITRTVAEGATVSVLTQSDPPAFRVLSARRDDDGPFQVTSDDGEVMWQRWVCVYYDDDTRELLRKEQTIPASEDTDTIMGTAPTIDAMISSSGQPRVLARNVSGLVLSMPSTNRMSASLTVETQSRKFGANAVTLTTEIPLKM